jgi:signal peptidase II
MKSFARLGEIGENDNLTTLAGLDVVTARSGQPRQGMFLMQEAMAFGWLIASAVFTLAFDQASKRLVLRAAHPYARPIATGPGPRLHVCMNRHATVALLPRRYALLLWAFCLAGAMVLVGYSPLLQRTVSGAGVGIAFGGATSNLLDCWRHGAVIDFIDLRIWPVFNIADACIVLGVIGTLSSML